MKKIVMPLVMLACVTSGFMLGTLLPWPVAIGLGGVILVITWRHRERTRSR